MSHKPDRDSVERKETVHLILKAASLIHIFAGCKVLQFWLYDTLPHCPKDNFSALDAILGILTISSARLIIGCSIRSSLMSFGIIIHPRARTCFNIKADFFMFQSFRLCCFVSLGLNVVLPSQLSFWNSSSFGSHLVKLLSPLGFLTVNMYFERNFPCKHSTFHHGSKKKNILEISMEWAPS